MGRPDFDANVYENTDTTEPVRTSIENAYFGAGGAPESSVGVLVHEETSIGYVFGTRVENADGTP